jgi:hypothetical protein
VRMQTASASTMLILHPQILALLRLHLQILSTSSNSLPAASQTRQQPLDTLPLLHYLNVLFPSLNVHRRFLVHFALRNRLEPIQTLFNAKGRQSTSEPAFCRIRSSSPLTSFAFSSKYTLALSCTLSGINRTNTSVPIAFWTSGVPYTS